VAPPGTNGGGLGSWLSSLLGSVLGGGVGSSGVPALGASDWGSQGFAGGGWTGPGPRRKPAGLVHAGEVVWSQDDVARAGGAGIVDAMRRGMAPYWGGGVVGARSAGSFSPSAGVSGQPPGLTMHNTYDLRGSNFSEAELDAKLQARDEALIKQLPNLWARFVQAPWRRGIV